MKLLVCLLLTLGALPAKILRDIAYASEGDSLQTLDVYLPDQPFKGGTPVVIGIHGGAWAFGDKSNLGFVQPKARWFNSQGFLFVSINYRLSPKVTHPEHIEDVCQAVTWIEENIASHGGDPKQLYLLGHSAGAHLAALAAVDEAKLKKAGADPKSIRGAILLDGAAYHVPNQIATALRKNNIYTKAFTLDEESQKDASPTLKVSQMKGTPPPFLILHVAKRKESRAQSETLAKALRAKGGKAQVMGIEGKTHGTINRDLGKAEDATTKAVAKFLNKR